MSEVYIAQALRTPIGRFLGTLKDYQAADLGEIVLKEILQKTSLPPDAVDEVFIGSALQAGQGQNVARQIALKAGLALETPATTVNMVCGSGLQAVLSGVRSILAGDNEIVVVGGTESMSNAPYLDFDLRTGLKMGHNSQKDALVYDGLEDAFSHIPMGLTSENLVSRYNLTRQQLDEYAYQSQLKAKQAIEAKRFEAEIVPIKIQTKKESFLFKTDEHPRFTPLEKLLTLKPAFKAGGSVTAGNSSGINDGAALLVLTTKKAATKYHLPLLAKITGWGQAGVSPEVMGLGPIEATKKALKKADLTLANLDLVELNEAFSAQVLVNIKELNLDPKIVNINGGAIALGHPIGASGARILVSLVHALLQNKTAKNGLASLCVGGGMGISVTIQKV